MSFNVGGFLKKHRALMTYLYDSYGFKRGVAISIPDDSNKRPLIGFAFFEEVVTRCASNGALIKEDFIGSILDIPLYKDTFKRHRLDVLDSEVRSLPKMCISSIPFNYHSVMSKEDLRDCILLAYSRCNDNSNRYFLDDRDACQRDSVMLHSNNDKYGYIYLRVDKDNIVDINGDEIEFKYLRDTIIDQTTVFAIRQKIREFEYRAYRYYKYIPGYRSTHNISRPKSLRRA